MGKALDLLLTTNDKPYKFELFAPALLDKIKPGMTEAKISVEHNPGQSLEIKTNFEKFTGLKIYKTGSGNERKVEFLGKESSHRQNRRLRHSCSKIMLMSRSQDPGEIW